MLRILARWFEDASSCTLDDESTTYGRCFWLQVNDWVFEIFVTRKPSK